MGLLVVEILAICDTWSFGTIWTNDDSIPTQNLSYSWAMVALKLKIMNYYNLLILSNSPWTIVLIMFN